MFTALGGRLAVNFVNTVRRQRGAVVDLLSNPPAVYDWLVFMMSMGQLHQIQHQRIATSPITPSDLLDLYEFRQKGREVLLGARSHEEFLRYLEWLMTNAPLSFAMVEDESNPQKVALPIIGGSHGLLALLANDWMDLVARGDRRRIRACANPRCLAYFINASGRRKWCSMEECGNRAKNAKYHRAKRQASKAEGD